MGTFTKDPSGDIEEEEAIYNAAMHRTRINKIIQTGIYKDDYIPKGGDRHPDDPTEPTGDGTTGGTTLGTSTPAPGETWHPGVGGKGNTGNQGTDTPSGHAGDWGPGAAQGGRIGYNRGRVVNPGGYQGEVEESEFSIFSPKTWFSGGPESETNPTLFGTQNSLMNKTAIINLEKAIGFYEASGKLDQEQQLDYELKLKQLEALIAGSKGQAEGGLIGYFDGGIARLL